MSDIINETEAVMTTDWTRANLQKLLAAMKTSIPENYRMSGFTQALKTVDWNEVAFPPFLPEACQQKWTEILQKMRKIRTLTELIDEAEDVIANPVRNIKIHPELPKRPAPPNSMFYEENYTKFHQQHPELSPPKLLKFVNKKYKKLPNEEKAQYAKKFQLASKKYKRDMVEFRQQYHEPPIRERRNDRKRVCADAIDQNEQHSRDEEDLPPKPPVNGYNLFREEQLGSMAGVSVQGFSSVWAQRWRDLTDRQRHEYRTRCRELKKQYSIDLNQYLKNMDEEEQERVLNKHGIKRPKECKSIKSKVKLLLPGEPKMPSRSGNIVFCKDQMEFLKEKFPNSKERLIRCSQMWRDLSNKEKEHYKEKAYEKFTQYLMELQKWFKTLTPAEQIDYKTCNPTKCQYLDAKEIKVYEKREVLYRPSDSEDEDIEYSSSDEEEDKFDCEEDEEEEEGGDIMFEIY